MTEDRLTEVKTGKLCAALVRFRGPVREGVASQWVIGKGKDRSQGKNPHSAQLSSVVRVRR